MIRCSKCNQWAIKDTDDYCSFCGFLQLDISVEPQDIVLISGIVAETKITFSNSGDKNHHIEILQAKGNFKGLEFSASNAFALDAGSREEIGIHLVEDLLPENFTTEELDFVCLIDSDERKTINFKVIVKTGPKPAVLIDEIKFGDVEEEKEIESWTEIANKGGIPLKIKDVRVIGSSQFKIESGDIFNPIFPNRKLRIPVTWKSPKAESNHKRELIKMKVDFENFPESLFIPIKGRLFKYNFRAEPNKIQIDEALSKQVYSKKITLINEGTKDVEITAIEPDREWIKAVSRTKSFTLLCEDSVSKKTAADATVFGGKYTFELVFFPQKLEAGLNKGKVTVYTTKKDFQVGIDIQLFVIYPTNCNDYIGIDFGTTNSVVAIWDDEEADLRLVEDENPVTGSRTPLIPSVLVFQGRPDNYKIGTEAESEADVYPEMTVRSIKRVMGYGNDRVFFEQNFSPEDLAALIIKKLIEFAEERLYRLNKGRTSPYLDIRKAIVTVPANFYDLQIRGILTACEKAGIDIEEKQAKEAADKLKKAIGHDINAGIILDEPSAAALFYLSKFQEENKLENEFNEKFSKNKNIHFLIFDYGGGTLDVSVVQINKLENKNIGIKVLANKGDNLIGGDSIDLSIMKELLKICKKSVKGFDISLVSQNFNELEKRRQTENWNRFIWAEVLRVRSQWKNAAEKIKIAIDKKEKFEFKINSRNEEIFNINDGKLHFIKGEFKVMITREQVIGWIKGLLDKCKNVVGEALSLADIEAADIDYIIHTGRSSLMPNIQQDISTLFRHLNDEHVILDKKNLKICVAKGAALYGLLRSGIQTEHNVRLVSGGRRLPHSYGVQVMRITKPMFEPIIETGTKYPTEKTKHYDDPGSRFLTLRFLQNSSVNNNIKGNPDIRVIGAITVDTLADNVPGCDVKFMIDANRKMEVSADGVPVQIKPARLEDEDRWIG
ncbi:MAG: Hsp70 family protein [Candidatus Aminicenantes bacterium]|nr:Hsp70 family protein [Candidatus Aminicenantes bacterium]